MPWMITLCQISSFLRPVAAGMVALMASSMAGRWDLRTEVAGVLFLVRRRIVWLVVNSRVAIRGFLIADLLLLLYLITLMEPEAMKRQLTYMVRLPHLVPNSVSFMIVATFEWTPVINANDPLTKEIPLSA